MPRIEPGERWVRSQNAIHCAMRPSIKLFFFALTAPKLTCWQIVHWSQTFPPTNSCLSDVETETKTKQ